MKTNQIHLCFVGNMLGRNAGYITTQGQFVADLFAAEGYQTTCVSAKINRLARITEIISTLIKSRHNFDIVVLEVYSGLYFFIAEAVALLCKNLKLPLIMVLHGGSLPEFIERHPLRVTRVLNQANYLVAPSRFLAKKLEHYGYQIRVIPNVIELDKYPFRQRGKISPRLVWMRSFHPFYNPEMAIEVLNRLRQTEPQATLTMAGVDKGFEGEIKQMAADLKLSEAVNFCGFLDEENKMKEFAAADIFINTNRIDNMPVAVIEACATGLPVVATKVGGLPYLIANGENGLLVADNDAAAMVTAIKKLLDDAKLTEKISRNGRMLAERSAWTAVSRNWEAIFSELLGTTEFSDSKDSAAKSSLNVC